MEKKLQHNYSKSIVRWWVMLVVFTMSLAITSCGDDCDCPEPEENYPSLKVTNDLEDDWRSITKVSLIGYKFENLNIEPFGDSQTFVLDKGMSGGYENINVTVSYIRYQGVGASASINVDFTKGETTSITLTGCDGAEGCSGIYLE